MAAYYNELDPWCCGVLKRRIADGRLPPGDVDDRDVRTVPASDLAGYTQVHLFAGVGGFGYACRLAGWGDDEEIWTAGFPCQPFSIAGLQQGISDDRFLWPEVVRLLAAQEERPPRVCLENVDNITDMALDRVLFDLEALGYAARPFWIPACAVDAPHERMRVWIPGVHNAVGLADGEGVLERESGDEERTESRQDARPDAGRLGGRDDAVGQADGTRDGRRQERADGDGFRSGDSEEGIAAGFESGSDDDAVVGQADKGDGFLSEPERGPQGRDGTGSTRAIAGKPSAVALGDGVQPGLEGHAGHGDGSRGRKDKAGPVAATSRASPWRSWQWIPCSDGKARRAPEPVLLALVDGIPGGLAGLDPILGSPITTAKFYDRRQRLSAIGNAIVPEEAAIILEILRAA